MSGKETCPSSLRRPEQHRLISRKPSRLRAKGNLEGSPGTSSPGDPVTTDPKGEVGRLTATYNTPALTQGIDTYEDEATLDPWYVTGLTEGEGCFCISFSVRRKMRLGLEVRPSFSLSLNERDRVLLGGLQAFFGCGAIRQSKGDRTFKYEARSTSELIGNVLPHFERYPLRGNKARSFRAFSSVCEMIEQGDHLKRDGLREIVCIACRMNLGKRRYREVDLLRELGEVKG